jgi:hypothetical protein
MKVIPYGSKALIVKYDANLKNHLRLFDDADEALVTSYIRAAGDYIEKYIGLPILSNQFTVIGYADDYNFELPKGTVAISAIQERQSDGTWEEIIPITEQLDNYGVYCQYYDEALTDGYEYKFDIITECQVSNLVQQAAYLIISEMYEQRENRSQNTEVFRRSADMLLDAESLLL